MPAYSRQLKDEDDNIIYPITTAENVVDTDGVDLQTRVDTGVYLGTGSVSSLSPWVDTSDIIDGAVTANKIDFSTMPGNYSLTEVNTGYAWIDGSPIYKKTISFGALPNNTTKSVDHNISNFNFAIKIEGFAVNTAGDETIPLPLPSKTAASDSLELTVSSSKVMVSTKNSGYWSSTFPTCYITLYYTKLLS